MGHEIEKRDGLVLHRNQAWHGLGTIVEDAPTPREALTLAGMDWKVVQRPLFAKTWDTSSETIIDIALESHVGNYRDDLTGPEALLGVVTKGYKPVCNSDMADFCSALLEEGIVHCETAGSIRNGKKCWFLLKGESFSVANEDEMYPYICVSNGHDGSTSFRVTPTTVRVVCSNTLHCVLPNADTGQLSSSAICIRHTTNVMERVKDAQHALKHYRKSQEKTRTILESLAKRDVKRDEIQAFFLECYTHDFLEGEEVPLNPKNKREKRQQSTALDAYSSFTRRFDDERKVAGASMWNCVNAYSGLVQHDRKSHGKNDAARVENRVGSNLFGLSQERTQRALQVGFAMSS